MSIIARALAKSTILLAAASCGRVIKLSAPNSGSETTAVQVMLPEGARCRADRDTDASWQGAVAASCTDQTVNSWPVWTDALPPGICYEASGKCRDVPDGVAYLTFDDGPSDWTADVLDTLAAQAVHATFFVNAYGDAKRDRLAQSYRDDAGHVTKYHDVLRRVVDEGHALGNHTRDHADLGMLTRDQIDYQYNENERLVNDALVHAGATPRPISLLRPPFGAPWRSHSELADPEKQQEVAGRESMRFGYNVLWNIDSTDSREWASGEASTYEQLRQNKQPRDAAEYADKVERLRTSVLEDPLVQSHAGIVVLMHDTHNTTRDALTSVIDGLRAQGYRFATVEQQVSAQFERASVELTPGPAMGGACSDSERTRSCLQLPAATDQVCGRFWLAFEQLGGAEMLGAPIAKPEHAEVSSQEFEHGRIELHPEWPAPCDVVFIPS